MGPSNILNIQSLRLQLSQTQIANNLDNCDKAPSHSRTTSAVINLLSNFEADPVTAGSGGGAG